MGWGTAAERQPSILLASAMVDLSAARCMRWSCYRSGIHAAANCRAGWGNSTEATWRASPSTVLLRLIGVAQPGALMPAKDHQCNKPEEHEP